MMSKLVIRKTTAKQFDPTESEYVKFETFRRGATNAEWQQYELSFRSYLRAGHRPYALPHDGIALPAVGIVQVMHRLMTRVQEEVRPSTPYAIEDNWVYHDLSMRWEKAGNPNRMQLTIHGDSHGIWIRLEPYFANRPNSPKTPDLAHWRCERDRSWNYGELRVYRGEHLLLPGQLVSYHPTPLVFEDPVFEGIPRHDEQQFLRPWRRTQPDELGEDVVRVVQIFLDASGLG